MKVYKTIDIPARQEKQVDGITCDYCGKQGKSGWDSSRFNHNETEVEMIIKHYEGTHYPDDSWGDKFVTDICPECFRYKLVPFLQSIARSDVNLEYEYYH